MNGTPLAGQGYRLLDLEIFKDSNGFLRYAGVYGAGSWDHRLVHDLTKADFNLKCYELAVQGFQLVDVEVYKSGVTILYAGVFKSGSGNYHLSYADDWTSFTSKWATQNAQGYRLVDLDTDGTGGNTIYCGIFLPGNDGYSLSESNWNYFYSYWEHVAAQGLRLVDFNVRPAIGPGLLAGAGEGEETSLTDPVLTDRSEKTIEGGEAKVFPNPASDQFSISADADIQAWTLYNALGRVVLRNESEVLSQNTVIQVDALPIGLYQLTLRTTKGSLTRPVEVMR